MKAFIVEPSEIRVGGVSLRERQERMLRQAGIAEILRAPHEVPPDPPKEEVLVLAGNMLIDPRIVHALVDQNGNVMAIDSRSNGAWVGASRNDYFHLNRDNEPALLDIATLDDYVPKLRRHIPIYWLKVETQDAVRRAEQILINSAEKDPSDLMAKFVHRPIENWVVAHLTHTSITPNQITLIVNTLAYIATVLFATGHLVLASLLTFLVGLSDGFDGKLARLKGMVTKVGSLEHAFDLLFEFSWILALGFYLSRSEGTTPLLLAASIVTLVAFYRSIYDRYGQAAGKSLDVAGKFENLFRRVAGRRNLFNLHILVFVLYGRPLWALYTIFAHAGLTALVYSLCAWRHLRKLDRA
ncbi:CDP-alcohol phosphatidyltransferase family protein [Candidatus Acetothermia bacterium]|nr:CDP-alcohol phosphatidyltransferase family protein [Candidatus Acetothermia bacterium]